MNVTPSAAVSTGPTTNFDLAAVQRRTLRLLFVTQIISGIGVAIGASVGALLAAQLAGVTVSGFAVSAVVVGSALLALPATEIVRRSGRRLSLAAAYLVAAIGSIVVVVAAMQSSIALLFAGFFLLAAARRPVCKLVMRPSTLRPRQCVVATFPSSYGQRR